MDFAHMESRSHEYLIEELNCNDISEWELSQFKETQPLEVIDILTGDDGTCHQDSDDFIQSKLKSETEEMIQKFVEGESDLADLCTKLEPEDLDEEPDLLPSTSTQICVTNTNIENSDHNHIDGVNTTPPDLVRQRIRGATYRKRNLNVALQGLMGEANLCYARGQVEIAEKICLEIVRQNPLAPEPFFTLAEIYETRDREKYLNFLTIAAHLNPHDRDLWIRITNIHIAEGNTQRAKIYYSKAIKVLPKDYDMRLRKARLLELMGDTNSAMFTYLKMIPHVPFERAELCLVTAKSVAHHFYSLSKLQLAKEAMDSAYEVCAHLFSPDDLNLYLELLILSKNYTKVLSCLREHTGLKLETEQENNLELVFFCVIPDDYIPDFRSKLCVSLIHLHASHLLGYLILNVHEHIPVTVTHLNLYVDVAEALMHEQKYSEAIELLSPIIEGKLIECPAFIWLRHAECLRNLQRYNEAIDSYYRVLELAPFCYEAKFTLSALLKQHGRPLEAVKVLEQDCDSSGQPQNARLLYERCLMLKQINEINEYLEVGYILLGRHSVKLRNREEMLAAANGGSFYNAEGLKVILQMRNITEETETMLQDYNTPYLENSDLAIQDEYRLFIDLIETAFSHRKFSFMERICFAMVTTKRFVGFHIDLERIIILACYFNDDCAIAFSYLRELISKNLNNLYLWNFLSLLIQKGQDLRYHRYVRRLIARQPCARKMRLFLAHYHLHCCSYKYALNIYVPVFKEQPDPLIALCIAVVFNQLSLQKKLLRKPAAVAQAITFVHKYSDLRMSSTTQQEIFYNIGRIYHQAGQIHLALEYYERGLGVSDEIIEKYEYVLGLKQEIAYNIHLIYLGSGNLRKDYNTPYLENSDLAIQDEYRLFIDLIETAFSHRKFSFMERICFAMVTTKRFVGFHIDLERIIILACYFNDDCAIAFSYLRELISKNLNNLYLWNFLSLLIQKGQDLRYHRYVRRLTARQPCARKMRLFLAHYHLHCCSYKYALNIYVPVFKEQPDPLIALCIAVVFNQLSLQKKLLRKPAAVAQAITFVHKYSDLRMSSTTQQEIFYNIGRIYHQAGQIHLALEYYERGLGVSDEIIEKYEYVLGLKQEIAYNIHLIYLGSGNLRKARQYLYEYIAV